MSQGILILLFIFVIVNSAAVSPTYLAANSMVTSIIDENNVVISEVLPSDYRLAVELWLEERSAWCSLYMRHTSWSNQSQAIEAVQKEISSRLNPYNLTFNIEYVKFSVNASMDVDFTVPNLPVNGEPLNFGYNDYSVELGWLVDWAKAPFTQWEKTITSSPYFLEEAEIEHSREVEGKTYRFELERIIRLQGYTSISELTNTSVSYSIFIPKTILKLDISQDKIKVVNITNFSNKTEFNRLYALGEQYRDEVLKNAIAEEAKRLNPYNFTADNFEVYMSEPSDFYLALMVHYVVQGAVENIDGDGYKVDLRFLNMPLSEFTISSHPRTKTVLGYMGDLGGEKILVAIHMESIQKVEGNIIFGLPVQTATTTVTTATTTTTATSTTTTPTTTMTTATTTTQKPGNPLVTVIAENYIAIGLTSLTILAGALIWRGHVRSVWNRGSFDYDTFRLLVRMRGGGVRVNLLRSLGEQKNKLQLAKELDMDWKAVDRNIRILLKYGLIMETESVGKVKFYSLTPDGKKVLELLEELNSVEVQGGKDL